MGVYLDRVLRLSDVHGYDRVEHGHTEHVGGYERVLRDLTGGAPGEGLGRLREQDFPQAISDLEANLRPAEEGLIKDHLDQAHEALTAGDYAKAGYHLNNAKQVVAMSQYNAGSLRRVLTEAQAHMSTKANEALDKPSLLDRFLGGAPEYHNIGPGGIIRRNTKPDPVNLPVQVDLAEPVVRFLEGRQAKREAKARGKAPKVPKLPKLL